MAEAWRDAVFRIDSDAEASHAFGSGFVCQREGDRTYLLTCDHVIAAIGEARARIRQLPIQVVARGDDTLDLALIAVDGLTDSPVLSLSDAGESGQPFVVYGHTWADPNDKKSGKSLARPLEGRLGADTAFASDQWPKVPAWDLPFDENDQFAELLDGYSGSPVWDPHNQSVIAVVSHRRGKKMGYAIAVSNLLKLYPQAAAFFRPNVSASHDPGRPRNPIPSQPPIAPPRTNEAGIASKQFDVALSFSGADRPYVSRVADELAKALGRERVFYDANFKGELARPNLDTYLERIYAEQSRLCAVFLSASYAGREWCGIEWRVMRDILKKKRDEEIMYFKLDDAKIEGMLSIDGYVDIRTERPSVTAELILRRHNQIAKPKAGQEQHAGNASSSSVSSQSRAVRSADSMQKQSPLEPPSGREFRESIRKTLIERFSHSRLSGAAEILLGYQSKVESTQAVDVLMQLEPLEAVTRWNEVVTELYDKTSIIGEAQRDVWSLLESVHLYLLPRLVDLTRLVKDSRFPQDALLFTIAAPHEPPNRPIELLFARMNRQRVVQFEQRGGKEAQDFAVPSGALYVTDPAFRERADPDIESAVEQLGFELMRRFYLKPGEQMGDKDWRKLNAMLKAGRHGKLSFYLVIPHGDHYADPAFLSRLYSYLPNLPKFLMADAVGDELPFVCEPDDIDAAIVVFWDLKIKWCGERDSKQD